MTMDDPNDWQDHAELLEEGFARYNFQRIVTQGDHVATLEVAGGERAKVEILAAENFTYAVAPEERPQLMMPGTGFVYSPVTEGADAGFAYVLIQGKAVGKIPVVYGQTVERTPEKEKTLWEKLFGGE